jgi:hypothetical protein
MGMAKKQFDAVSTMREIRDRLSAQVEGMSFEEEKRFIRKHVPQPKGRRSKKPPNELRILAAPGRKRRKGRNLSRRGKIRG